MSKVIGFRKKKGIMLGTGHKSNVKARHKRKVWWKESNYSATVKHPSRFENGVYAVNIHRNGTIPVDRNRYFAQVTAKSPASAYTKVINTPDFKRWKENLEKRIKEGKERTDYRM